MRILFVLFYIVSTAFAVNAQKYTTAAGVRIGSGIGISLQQQLWGKYTMEAIVQKNLFKDGTHISVLFQSHYKLLMKGLNFYVGAGPHLGLYDQSKNANSKTSESTRTPIQNSFGIAAIGGLELRINRLLLSYDYQPGINFRSGEHLFSSQTGLSVRYILLKAKKKKKNQDWMFWKKLGQHPDGDDD